MDTDTEKRPWEYQTKSQELSANSTNKERSKELVLPQSLQENITLLTDLELLACKKEKVKSPAWKPLCDLPWWCWEVGHLAHGLCPFPLRSQGQAPDPGECTQFSMEASAPSFPAFHPIIIYCTIPTFRQAAGGASSTEPCTPFWLCVCVNLRTQSLQASVLLSVQCTASYV